MSNPSGLKLSRRGFLQALGLATAATILPSVATKELIATSTPSPMPEAYLIGTVGDSLLDAPIDEEHPFGWIQINGERMKLHHIRLTVSNQFIDPLALIWPQTTRAFPSEICRQIDFSTMGEYPSIWGIFASQSVVDFAVDIPEYPNVFSGNALISNFSDSMDHDGRFTRECSMNLVGDFQVKLSSFPSGWII